MNLTNRDLNFVVSRLPRDVRSLLSDTPGLFVGGGFIRETIAGNKPNDIDLFGGSVDTLKLAAKLMAEKRGGRVFFTDNAGTVLSGQRMPLQFITRWLFTDPQALIESFDFTVCQAVIWKADGIWHSAVSDDFYSDLAARRLVYTYPKREEEAGGSLMRVRKFLARGWNIQAPSLAGVVARVVLKVDMDRIGTHADREAQLAKVVTGLLREVDPNIVIDGIEPVDEHEIVNPETT